ncbi:CsgG/HfaB family protein, partial [Phascolarctobacterium succinatutens]|uniref:CsgG/HfaB family protein n=1 Tax=Phascolarctobacterium succinatutens TaxID=626940 RepID=UPI0026F2C96A
LSLLVMTFSATCFAAKKVVAVTGVEYSSSAYMGQRAAADFESQLVTALVDSGRYDVVERNQLNYVVRELGLQSSGMISGNTAIQFGQLTGADYTVVGNVIAADVESFNNYLYKGYKGKVKFNFKFIDNKTGMIKIAKIVEGSDTVSEYENKNPDRNILMSGAVNDASKKIVELINSVNVLTGVVAAVNNDKIYIDLGSDAGAHVGEKYIVFREGNVVTHPVTGEIIAVEENYFAQLKVVEVNSNYSVCEIVKAKKAVQKGDKIKRGTLK